MNQQVYPNAFLNEGSVSITRWLDDFREGDQSAAEKLWRHYFETLKALGDRILANVTLGDGEDAVVEALAEVFRQNESGGFEILDKVKHRGDLTPILVQKTKSRALDILRKALAKKRHSPGAVPLDALDAETIELTSREGSPELMATVREELKRWCAELPPRERDVVEYILDGFNLNGVADRLEISVEEVNQAFRRAVRVFFHV